MKRASLLALLFAAFVGMHGNSLATVKVTATIIDGPNGNERLTEERQVSHSLSLAKNSTSSSVSADLSTGVLRAVAVTPRETNSNFITLAAVDATVTDTITFAPGTNGTAFLDWGFDGSLQVEQNKLRPTLSSGAYLNLSVTAPNGNVSGSRLATVTASNQCNGAASQYCIAGVALRADVAMRGSVPFHIAPGTFSISFSLGASVQAGDDALFGNTSYLYLRLPTGVTYSSNSGVFLANALPVPSPVPEPTPTLLFTVGILFLFIFRRYIRNWQFKSDMR